MQLPGLIGGSYQEWSRPFDHQRSINLYPVADKEGKGGAAMYGTPGLQLFATTGNGSVRGELAAANGRAFVVSGLSLYEISELGAATELGSLDTSVGNCTLADNGFQLAICDQTSLYILTYATNAFVKVTDVDLPPVVGSVWFLDGYFVVNEVDTGKFYISGQYDGLSWNALDFASAESSPDKLVVAANFIGQLGLFGETTLEIWRNTGDATFPFQRISGATPIGTIAPFTVVNLDTSIFWVGNTQQGTGIVYRAQGFSPVRISTHPIERILQAVANPADLSAFTYQQDGHVFYCITGSDLQTTLCYDLSTQIWHERAYLGDSGELGQHLASSCMFAFNKHLVGSRLDGKIYEMSPDFYSDDGEEIYRQRIFTHLVDEYKRIKYSRLELGFETGVGGAPLMPIDPDAQAIIDAMDETPIIARQYLINSVVTRLKLEGLWDKTDNLFMMAAYDRQAAKLNWKNPAQSLTEHGTVTFTVDQGFTSDGLTGYLSAPTNYNALTYYQQDSAHLGVWSLTDATNNGYDLGVDTGSNAVRLNSRNLANTVTGNINSSGAHGASVANSLGHSVLTRTGSAVTEIYKDGISLGNDTDVSAAALAAVPTILANRPNNTGSFSTRTIPIVHIGGALTDAEVATYYDILNEYMAGLSNDQPPSFEPVASLRLSKDGARTWSNSYTASIGYIGEYGTRCVWRRLGIGIMMTFEVTITAPMKVAISGAYLS